MSYEEREIRSAHRSISGSERREQVLHEEGQEALAALGESDGKVPIEVVILRSTYRAFMQTYTRKIDWALAPMNERSIRLWSRVEEARKKADVTPEQFIKAQFVWFHTSLGRAPTLAQLATKKAVDRARESVYGAEPAPKSNPISSNVQIQSSLADVFKYNEQMLQSMMRAQKCTRAEFYRKFVLSGEFTFDTRFLQADPVYIKVYNEDLTKVAPEGR